MVVQAELVVGPADDAFEREADLVAAQVVEHLRRPAPVASVPTESARIQASGDSIAPLPTDEQQAAARVQRRRHDRIVRRAGGVTPIGLDGGAVDDDVADRISRSSGHGTPLADPVRRSMEDAFGGVDFGRVRLHTGPESDDLNSRLGARAFTVGNDIHFSGPAPDAGSPDGQRLLAHELTHTIQQGSTGRRSVQRDRLDETLPANLRVTQTAPDADKHGAANDVLEHLQHGTGAPGQFADANSFQENMGRSQLGDTQVQGNFKVAAGAMAGFDLVVSISKAIQIFTDGEATPWDKAEAALGLAGGIGNAAVGGSAIATVADSTNTTADVANKVLTEIAGFVGIFQGGFKIVKQIVALAEGGTSDQEKAQHTSELIIGILETGKGIVDQINNFMSHLGTVASGVVQAAPAIGIAINCMDMIMNGINMGYAYCAYVDMQRDKRASKEAVLGGPAQKSSGIRGFFGGHKSAVDEANALIGNKSTTEAELLAAQQALQAAQGESAAANAKVQALEADVAALEAKPQPLGKSDKKALKKAKSDLAKARRQAGIKEGAVTAREGDESRHQSTLERVGHAEEYLVSKSLQRIAGKRINRSVLNISLTLPAIAGDIAILSGAGAAAGAGLKAASGGGKLLAVGIRMGKQAYHDYKGDEKSTASKLRGYDHLIKSMTAHAVAAGNMPATNPAETLAKEKATKKATREIVASGMSIPKMRSLSSQPPPKGGPAKLYLEWLEALKKR